ncbi:hypothetical protein AWRI1631_164110 [Saccharomyces cerevisiae AWRI1631]|uniref:Uncharacterized protein n=1 Tax=Saccharomyces cerevisiae (strain AWRI1631) TaxID=545124 RepID=B5VTU7_YEAS6|nr:hypothetical protein AWRI1631_164110 [Saccharomyces cerevisiae AWRI1631]
MRELFTFLLRLQEEGEVQMLIGVVLEAPISKVMEEKMHQILIGVPLEVLTSEVQEEKEKKLILTGLLQEVPISKALPDHQEEKEKRKNQLWIGVLPEVLSLVSLNKPKIPTRIGL